VLAAAARGASDSYTAARRSGSARALTGNTRGRSDYCQQVVSRGAWAFEQRLSIGLAGPAEIAMAEERDKSEDDE